MLIRLWSRQSGGCLGSMRALCFKSSSSSHFELQFYSKLIVFLYMRSLSFAESAYHRGLRHDTREEEEKQIQHSKYRHSSGAVHSYETVLSQCYQPNRVNITFVGKHEFFRCSKINVHIGPANFTCKNILSLVFTYTTVS